MASVEDNIQEQSAANNETSLDQIVKDTASDYASFVVTDPEKEARNFG